jgi:hypothetical protein
MTSYQKLGPMLCPNKFRDSVSCVVLSAGMRERLGGLVGRPAARCRASDMSPSLGLRLGLLARLSPYLRHCAKPGWADRRERLGFEAPGNYSYASSKTLRTGSD